MKVNNICFCLKHQLELRWDQRVDKNRFILLFVKQKNNVSDEVTARGDSIILFDKEGIARSPETNESNVLCWIDFVLDEDEIKRLLRVEIPLNQSIRIKNSQVFLDILQMMYREFYAEENQSKKTFSAYLELFFTKLCDVIADKRVTKQPQFEKLCSIRAEIYANPSKRMTVKELAGKAYLSVSYFQHLYKEYFNTTVITDMILSRIEKGKHLLVSTNDSIKGIAKELNYGDEVSFVRQFQKIVGMSPGRYKKQFSKHKSNAKKR